MKTEAPFYTTLRDGDVLTVNGLPLRIVYIEKHQGGRGLVCLAVDAPHSGEIEFDKDAKSLNRW